jgi:predicted membrane protein
MQITKQRFGSGLIAISFAVASAIASAATPINTAGDSFPRLGLISTAGPQRYAASFQTFAAKHGMVIINGAGEGWERGVGYSKEKVIQGIKSQSLAHTRVFQYVGLNELYNSTYATLNPFPTWYKQVAARKWFLYPSTTAGTPVTDPQSSQKWLVDMAPQVPVDPTTALGPYGWAAKYVNDLFHMGRYAGTSASPSLDGFFLDNVLIDPSNGMGNVANGDWIRVGSSQSHASVSTYNALMAGEKQFFSYLDTAWPGSQQLGNSGGTFGLAASNWYSGISATLNSQILSGTSTLSGVMEGGTIEHIMGRTYSIEYYGGSLAMQKWYQTAMANYGGSKLCVFSQILNANGSDPIKFTAAGVVAANSPAFQGMRYGIAAALMNNGYYTVDSGTYDTETEANRRWFDEFDNAGKGVGYLGHPVATAVGNPQAAAWSNGVWMREFQNGVVLWNPKGNGARAVNVAGLVSPSGHTGLKHIAGKQNPALNDGRAVTSVTLQDRDGLVLLWTTP